MRTVVTKVDRHGRVVIPAEQRRALGIKEGDAVVILLEEGELHILKQEEAIRRAQAMVMKYTKGRSLVDELIAERRAEAARESAEATRE